MVETAWHDLMARVPFATGWLFLTASRSGAQATVESTISPLSFEEIFTLLFLMLGPIKIIGPFAKMTHKADEKLARRLALRAILFSTFALFTATLLGDNWLASYGIPLSVLALAAGIVLFLVALQTVLQQFSPPERPDEEIEAPTLAMAITPLAFPTIVTPYGIAVLIVFVALTPDLGGKLMIGGIVFAIMVLNLFAMLLARRILQFMGVFLQILGAVLGIIQVALGLQIIISSLLYAFQMTAP